MMALVPAGAEGSQSRPNIVWLVSEDHGPHMGCYGDSYATTPNVDRLASQGLRYLHAWSNAPVCAPARTTIISGLYPPSTGAENMRSLVKFPEGKQMFPQLLRAAGYYCTNNAKEDYNLTKPGQVWDESSKRAHWRNRKGDQPFFAVFNSEKSHESRIRSRPHQAVHDPAKVKVPPYHPDTPEVRRDWAQYYDGVSNADSDAGARIEELKEAGLLEDTIVFYYADHGSGMPRNKRWLYTSGLHVPLVVHIPEKYRHLRPADYEAGGTTDRLVSFVDLAPTVLSLAGIQPPEWMQGHAFLGKYAAPPQPYVYSFRGRMDEKLDLARGVTDGRFVYIRNYMPHRPQGQYLNYMFQTPTTQVWHRLFVEGKLDAAQAAFWETKPAEELYDLSNDPYQTRNLADSRAHAEELRRLKGAQQEWCRRIRDVGFLPEGEMHRRSGNDSPYDMAQDESRYPMEKIFAAAELAAGFDESQAQELTRLFEDPDPAVRYWGAVGLLIRGPKAVSASSRQLQARLKDPSPFVRIAAAEALASSPDEQIGKEAWATLLSLSDWSQQDNFVSMSALNAIAALGPKAEARERIAELPDTGAAPDKRYADYVPRLLKELRQAND